ncbi:MAG: tetratricopeptide repeat protein [Planctomycetota bacterium]
MGLFDFFKQRKELKKLEGDVRDNPSPLAVATLGEKYLMLNKNDQARTVTAQALKDYPCSERIANLYQQIMKTCFQDKILWLHKEIERNANAGGYFRLAQLYYKEMGDLDKSLDILRDGINRFPDEEDLHLLNGQIRLERFHLEGFLSSDGLKAMEHLRRVIELNNLNYKALLLMIKLMVEIEAFAEAWKFMEIVRRFAPDDEAIARLAGKLKEQSQTTINEVELELLFKAVEERGDISSQAKDLSSFYKVDPTGLLSLNITVNQEKLNNLIKNFNETEGFKAAANFSPAGETLFRIVKPGQPLDRRGAVSEAPPFLQKGRDGAEPPDPETLIEVLKGIYQVAQDSSRKMDFGRLSKGFLLSPLGRLNFFRVGNFTVVCLFALTTKPEVIKSEIDWLLDMMSME